MPKYMRHLSLFWHLNFVIFRRIYVSLNLYPVIKALAKFPFPSLSVLPSQKTTMRRKEAQNAVCRKSNSFLIHLTISVLLRIVRCFTVISLRP